MEQPPTVVMGGKIVFEDTKINVSIGSNGGGGCRVTEDDGTAAGIGIDAPDSAKRPQS
jgi:hypothetical protein